jgi:uncharacterized membrane protein YoaK (UPF0700 family)
MLELAITYLSIPWFVIVSGCLILTILYKEVRLRVEIGRMTPKLTLAIGAAVISIFTNHYLTALIWGLSAVELFVIILFIYQHKRNVLRACK